MTLEGLGASVFPVVPGQLVRPGKLPAAAFPRTLVGFLPSVGSLVSFEVGALGVDLITVQEVALVNLPTFERVGRVGGLDHLGDGGHRRTGGSLDGVAVGVERLQVRR